MAEPVRSKGQPKQPKKPTGGDPKAVGAKVVTPKAGTPKVGAPTAAKPQKTTPVKGNAASAPAPQSTAIGGDVAPAAGSNDTVADEYAQLRARQQAEAQAAQEADDAAPWYQKRLDETWYSSGITDQAEKMAFDRTKRFIMMLKLWAGNKIADAMDKPVGVTKGTAAPLNGDMKEIAQGVSETMKHGVTPSQTPTLKPKGPKQDGPTGVTSGNKMSGAKPAIAPKPKAMSGGSK